MGFGWLRHYRPQAVHGQGYAAIASVRFLEIVPFKSGIGAWRGSFDHAPLRSMNELSVDQAE
jgi:hypothetical protein